ncbi:hypothetical protein DLC15_10675 [Salmonella enterica subsp. enterica serovar Telelkebir]|nr:hypothetical protein [Salmonella enterica]EBG8221543.1 hypothetical protein [Salmonella enterica subsp. enterica]EBU8553027.1 hypothetical protein [Salmonella enterica subsp. enterica serovar Telelkebir]ECB1174591.1 hypothetical protein [Salmonella enterica subsp. enterica serovar Essen]EEK2938450.1 hypothetical protein [Salmonella enterica]
MLPSSIRTLVAEVFTETREGRLVWIFDSNADLVIANYKGMQIHLDYKFDYNMEYGVYRLLINANNKEYYFTESMYDSDYDWLKQLHYEAQGSDFSF